MNAYCLQNVNRWKDLNSEFAISVLRDYVFMKKALTKHGNNGNELSDSEIEKIGVKFLLSHFESVKMVIETHLERYDKKGTGCIGSSFFGFFSNFSFELNILFHKIHRKRRICRLDIRCMESERSLSLFRRSLAGSIEICN